MAIGPIVTRGYGPNASIALVVTRGYSSKPIKEHSVKFKSVSNVIKFSSEQ